MLLLTIGMVVLLGWRNHVSYGVQEDVVAGLTDQLEELAMPGSGVSPEELAAYEREAAQLRSGLADARRQIGVDGSLLVVAGLLSTAPGMLVGLVLGAGLVGLELAGPRRTMLLAQVGRVRLAAALIATLGLVSVGLTIVSILGMGAANWFFSWLYHRPVSGLPPNLGGSSVWAIVVAVTGAWVWMLLGALAAAMSRSTLGGVICAGVFVVIDSIIARSIPGVGRFLLGPNILVIARSGGRTSSTTLLAPRVWFESWGDAFRYLAPPAAYGVVAAIALIAIGMLVWLWRTEEVIP